MKFYRQAHARPGHGAGSNGIFLAVPDQGESTLQHALVGIALQQGDRVPEPILALAQITVGGGMQGPGSRRQLVSVQGHAVARMGQGGGQFGKAGPAPGDAHPEAVSQAFGPIVQALGHIIQHAAKVGQSPGQPFNSRTAFGGHAVGGGDHAGGRIHHLRGQFHSYRHRHFRRRRRGGSPAVGGMVDQGGIGLVPDG